MNSSIDGIDSSEWMNHMNIHQQRIWKRKQVFKALRRHKFIQGSSKFILTIMILKHDTPFQRFFSPHLRESRHLLTEIELLLENCEKLKRKEFNSWSGINLFQQIFQKRFLPILIFRFLGQKPFSKTLKRRDSSHWPPTQYRINRFFIAE